MLHFLGVAKTDEVNLCGYYFGAPDVLIMLGAGDAPPVASASLEVLKQDVDVSAVLETIQSFYHVYHL
jgi:hypothetical protein